ncbi:MAG: AGE family epimerase/isomerase [Ginsengibacter sp.]
MTIIEYKHELEQELKDILAFWMKYTIDDENGGFYGKIDNGNNVYKNAAKGSVLNSRILWTFSAAYNLTKNINYLHIANRAFDYFKKYFIDKEFGGVYWSVDFKGEPLDTKKQVYALSFAVYGLSEYLSCSKNEEAKALSIELYNAIVKHSYDDINGGYFEAFTRDWKEIDDLRLSSKDANEKKSMNTHLHVLEGFANLHLVWPNEVLLNRITELVNIFCDHIIDKRTNHLILFFNEIWTPKSNIISYGHDIEAAWLIEEAAEITGNKELLQKIEDQSLKLANAASEGLDEDGGLWYEYDADDNHLIKEKHSWPQAESMIGFFNAWQIAGDKSYLEKSLNSWRFTQQYILDKSMGEWVWGVTENYSVMDKEKVGIWKCPYHNSRACIQLIQRITEKEKEISL